MIGASPALPQYDWDVMFTDFAVITPPSPVALYSAPEVPTSRSPKLSTHCTASMLPEASTYSTGSSSMSGRDLRKFSKSPVRDR